MLRKCSMCGDYKEESKEFRFMKHLNRYNAYCKDCNRWYNTIYKRVERAREKDKKEKLDNERN